MIKPKSIFSIIVKTKLIHMRFKSVSIMSVLLLTVVAMSAFMSTKEQEGNTNLKVLAKDIAPDDLYDMMEGFNTALGVKCNFCHAAKKDDMEKLDYASDAKPEKESTRSMIKMTMELNDKYFHVQKPYSTKSVLAVNCISCHNGKTHPDAKF